MEPNRAAADTLLLLRRDDEADKFIQQAVQIAERRHANNASVRTGIYAGLANIYVNHLMFPKARPLAEHALKVAKSRAEPDASSVASLQTSLGGILVRLGDAEAAEVLLKEAQTLLSEKFASDHDRIIPVLRNLSAVGLLKKKNVDALANAQEAVRLCKLLYTSTHPEVAKSLAQLAACYAALGENAMASTTYAQAIDIAEKAFGVDNPQTAELRSAREQLSAK
jgi:tetratricopeptide (TPR) repeat protein